tara:strand:+ start:209 stop:472 length:264 start_codon:yes stop_codon:yes gene_type:complete
MTRFEHKVKVWRTAYDASGQYHSKSGQGNLIRREDGSMGLTLINDSLVTPDLHPSQWVSMDIGRDAKALRDALNEFIAEEESAEEQE